MLFWRIHTNSGNSEIVSIFLNETFFKLTDLNSGSTLVLRWVTREHRGSSCQPFVLLFRAEIAKNNLLGCGSNLARQILLTQNRGALIYCGFQFIISRDGNCGLNYEHSVAEGVAVIRLIEYILKYM